MRSIFLKPVVTAVVGSFLLLLSFQNCNGTKFSQAANESVFNASSVAETCGDPHCQTDRYEGIQVCENTEKGPIYGVCMFERCKEPFELINGICQSRVCYDGQTQACEFEGTAGLRYCQANAWSSCKWIKATVNGESSVKLTAGQSYVVEVRSSEPEVKVESSSFLKMSGSCMPAESSFSPWNIGGEPVALGNNILDYPDAAAATFGGCVWRGQVIANFPGLSSYVDFAADKPIPNVNCVGAFGECTNGIQSYKITVPQSGKGSACSYANGATLSCIMPPPPVDCSGQWGTCVNGEKSYSVLATAQGGGKECPFTDGAKTSCGTACVGSWDKCSNGTQKYGVTTRAADGGLECPIADGTSRECGTPCAGSFGACMNGTQTYSITAIAADGGRMCSYSANSTQSCGTACVGNWGTCSNGTQKYLITTSEADGGMKCPYAQDATQACGTACVGSFGTCVDGMKTYSITTEASGGGAVCPYTKGQTQSCTGGIVNCQGSFGTCLNGSKSFHVTVAASGGGAACQYTEGTTQSCGNSCVGSWGACTNGTQSYSITSDAANGGLSCSFTQGATQACGTACVGSWGTCSNGTQTYDVTTDAANGGLMCPFAKGAVQSCGTACEGNFSQCSNGSQTYKITKADSGGGLTCPHADGYKQSCGTSCEGSFSQCSNGSQFYTITKDLTGGGATCPYASGFTQSCGISCQGSYGACSKTCGGGTKDFIATVSPSGGGTLCPPSGVSCNTQPCSCANGALASSYPTCNVCPSGQTYYGGKCIAACTNGGINPPLCNTCEAPAYYNTASGQCTVAVDVTCSNNTGTPFMIPYQGLQAPVVSSTCSNGIEVNNLVGGKYTISTTSGAATTVSRSAWIDFATYTAADSIEISVVNASNVSTTIFSQCVVRTADYGCGGVTGTPPSDSIRQYRLTIPPGTKKIVFDYGKTVSPFYLRMYGLCDFKRNSWTTVTAASGGQGRTYPEESIVTGSTEALGGSCGINRTGTFTGNR